MRVFKVAEKDYGDGNEGNKSGIPDSGNAKSDSGTNGKWTCKRQIEDGLKKV